MKQKKLNTWSIKRHNYIIESKTYDDLKTEKELEDLAHRFVTDHNIYDYMLKFEYSYKERK